ncbi:uncharacterized protein Gasu_65360 [Galdieria sulphuraria]|uniref:Uncharacterized protein n=1 Tax=Galdieria sulphuraria TaxID=130081 RepID=M2XQC8_GALSU|nr:uncharacterized protein Gasu_65360 [Galdieria sulphuraria]EME25803.1 hypothetical protein Gasu_65360 [Galdieria sulphuraria]|eukprot:XP_005702323.1 hypothetical protein Gasu_65360 [Galdieria sulphuraria]
MAIFKSTQSPLGWPLFSNFPHPLSPSQFPHSLPFPIGHILPPTHNGNFKSRSPWGWPKLAPFPTPFPPIAISPLSHFQFTHSFPPHTHNGNFQIKIARAHLQSATLSILPIFPISRKNQPNGNNKISILQYNNMIQHWVNSGNNGFKRVSINDLSNIESNLQL